MKEKALSLFGEAAAEGHYEQADDRTLFGNNAGTRLLERDARRDADMDTMKAQIKSLMEKTEVKDAEVQLLRVRFDSLAQQCGGFRALRHRFLEIVRDSNLVKEDPETDKTVSWPRIHAGDDAAAHHGDAVADAMLYTDGADRRHDVRLMVVLYGFLPATILKLSKLLPCFRKLLMLRPLLDAEKDALSIATMNEHASLISDTKYPPPSKLRDLFLSFAHAVESDLERSQPTTEHSAMWWKAYESFHSDAKCHRGDVKERRRQVLRSSLLRRS